MCAALVLILLSGCVAAYSLDTLSVAQQVRENVLDLLVEFSDGSQRSGFALLTDEGDDYLYAVCAYHSVAPRGSSTRRLSIRVRTYGASDFRGSAEVIHSSSEIDLALLRIDGVAAPAWKPFFNFSRLASGAKLRYIGKSGDWLVSAEGETIAYEGTSAHVMSLNMPDVIAGSSGAPLVSSSGIAGMLVEGSLEASRGLAMSEIRSTLLGWGFRVRSLPIILDSAAEASLRYEGVGGSSGIGGCLSIKLGGNTSGASLRFSATSFPNEWSEFSAYYGTVAIMLESLGLRARVRFSAGGGLYALPSTAQSMWILQGTAGLEFPLFSGVSLMTEYVCSLGLHTGFEGGSQVMSSIRISLGFASASLRE